MAIVKGIEQFPIELRCRICKPRSPLTILIINLKKIEEEKMWVKREKETARAIREVFGGPMPPNEFFESRK